MHSPFSDHSAIMLNIQSFDQRKKPGPGLLKFNASLLEDKEYVEKMRQNIPAFIEKHKDVLDPGLKWDVIKMEIRGFTMQYSKRRARLENDKENQLLIKLNELQERLCSSRNDPNLLNEYYTLEEVWNKKIKGTILRSKARWYENGEKNYKHFLNLEKRRRGIITLVPKKEKLRNLLSSLRPISLLNTDYKIAMKAIAKRLEAVLLLVINADQIGYTKGRYIGENVRLISDIKSYTAAKNLPGLAVFLDFEKAFDSIEWNFLFKVLDKLNFGPDFKNWVQTFYCNITSCVTNNSYASDFFNL